MAESVAKPLMNYFLTFGFPAYLKTDLSREFVDEIQAELAKVTGVVHLRTVGYSPRQNPRERTHRNLHAVFAKLLQRHRDWSLHLEYVQFCLNATVNRDTGFTANFLTFGRELSNCVNLILDNPSAYPQSHGEFAAAVVERMRAAYQLAYEIFHEARSHW
jgi:hypothetical protein